MDELIPIYEEYKSVYVDIGSCAMKKNDKLTEWKYEVTRKEFLKFMTKRMEIKTKHG